MGALRLAVALSLLACLANPARAGAGFDIRAVVREGSPAPTGGTFSGFGEVRLSGAGDVLFEALTGDRRGLFLASGGHIVPVAIQGDPTPLGGRYLQLSYFVLNDRQDVAFVATIERGRRDRRRAHSAIFLARGGKLLVFAKVREPAPVRGVFKEFRDLALDNSGRLAFFASLSEGDWPGGLFVGDGTATRRLVAVLDAAPIGGRFKEISSPALGPHGAVAFHGTVVDGGIRSGVFVATGHGVEKVVATGEASPVGGTFTQFANPLLNVEGKLYFWGAMADGRFPAALFVADGQRIRPLASRGAPSPAGPRYAYLGLDFSAGTAAAFQASLDGPGPSTAIFLADSHRVRVVVEAGDPCPTGGTFSGFGDPAVNARDEVAFVGSARGSDGIYLAIPASR